jgi:hypothetical protein
MDGEGENGNKKLRVCGRMWAHKKQLALFWSGIVGSQPTLPEQT